jgi:hypothetical protein
MVVVAAAAVVALAAPALAAPAEIDPGFGDDGVVVVALHEDEGITFQVTDVAARRTAPSRCWVGSSGSAPSTA